MIFIVNIYFMVNNIMQNILFEKVYSDSEMKRHEFVFEDSCISFDERKLRIEKIDEGLDLYFLEDGFCLYLCHNNVWNLVDLKTQYLSGVLKTDEFYFDFPGIFTKDNLVYYRIAKNGSSTMSALFGNKEGKWQNRDLKEGCKYIQLGDISLEQKTLLNSSKNFKFCILRDPKSRLISTIQHFYRLPHPFFNAKWIVSKGKFQTIEYFCRLMKILRKWHYVVCQGSMMDEMSHIIPQGLYMKKFLNRGFVVDRYVDLKDIRTFIEKDLNEEFCLYNGGGTNSGKIVEQDFKYVQDLVSDAIEDEIAFYKEKCT